MSDKLEFSFDATALGSSACDYKFKNIVVGEFGPDGKPMPEGGYKTTLSSTIVYGIAVHKFIDVMYKTGGYLPLARMEALKLFFKTPKILTNQKQGHLEDEKHLMTTCYDVWTEYVEKDETFELIQIPQSCYWCKGTGKTSNGGEHIDACVRCEGKGIVTGPATELTFKLKIYEDDIIIIWLTGTLDGLGKIRGGIYAIRDWKTTSSWVNEYFEQYWLSRQLRIYTIAAKLMAIHQPESIIGKIGATAMGAFIDGIFVKSKTSENEYKRSEVMQFKQHDLDHFMENLLAFCRRFSDNVRSQKWAKNGVLSGECQGRYGYKCIFWNVCKSEERLAQVLLKRDFQRKVYDPLNFNE